jgi:hypothetical protein
MATSTERMTALPEREHRGFRRLTIGVSEDDLRVIAHLDGGWYQAGLDAPRIPKTEAY